jgi:hypothetical protein
MARDEAERNIDLLIRDLQLAVGDIADIGAGSGTGAGAAASVDTSSQEPPTSVESTGRKIEKTKRSEPPLSSRREGERKAKPIGWVSLQNRLQELHSRWTEARRSAKAAVFSAISVHPSVTSVSKTNRSKESQRTTSLRSQDDFSSSRTPTARRTGTAKSTARGIKSAPLARIEESVFPTIQLSKILGVSPAQATGRSQDDVGDSLLSIALDLSRVHLLQQDLVNFSRVAFQFSHQIRSLSFSAPLPVPSKPAPTPRQQTGVSMNQSLSVLTEDLSFDSSFPSSQSTLPLHPPLPQAEPAPVPSLQINTDSLLSYEETLHSLRAQSRSLLLHLSCLAPLAPLSMGKTNGNNLQNSVGSYMPLSSSQTGLDLFIEMMIEILEPRKLFTPAIQRVMDRSKSEQINLLNSLHALEKTEQQRMKFGQESHEILKHLSRSLNEIFKGAIKELHHLQQSITTISRAWLVCVQARIPLPSNYDQQRGGNNSLVSVSPLEMLCRGHLGEELAAFINTFKLYEQDLQHLTDNINTLRKKLVHEFNSSVINSILICYQKMSEIFPPSPSVSN